MHCAVQFKAASIRIGQGTGVGRTAITGLSNSCVPVIDAGTLDTAVFECNNRSQCISKGVLWLIENGSQ